jgi:hypothetical protein
VARERPSTYLLHTNTNTQPRGFDWRIHCGVEATELSTNKQHSLSDHIFYGDTHTHGHPPKNPQMPNGDPGLPFDLNQSARIPHAGSYQMHRTVSGFQTVGEWGQASWEEERGGPCVSPRAGTGGLVRVLQCGGRLLERQVVSGFSVTAVHESRLSAQRERAREGKSRNRKSLFYCCSERGKALHHWNLLI